MTNKLAKSPAFNRSGAVHYRVEQRENGETGISLAVDFDRAPIPSDTYVADFCEVFRSEGDVVIVFGKIDFPSGKVLRNKIELYFAYQPFVYQLWRSTRRMHETLAKTLEEKGAKAKDSSVLSSETDKVKTMMTNNALIVQAGGQCALDFFLISAKDLWIKTRKGEALNMDALVRVFVSEQVLLEFLNRCNSIAQDLVKELKITFEENDDATLDSIEL